MAHGRVSQRDRLINHLKRRNPNKTVTLKEIGTYYAMKLIDEQHSPICYEWTEDATIKLYNGDKARVKVIECEISEIDDELLLFEGKPLSIAQLKQFVNEFN